MVAGGAVVQEKYFREAVLFNAQLHRPGG